MPKEKGILMGEASTLGKRCKGSLKSQDAVQTTSFVY